MDSNHFDSPQKLYADVAHPINSECRELIQNAVIDEFEAELARSHQPGYRSRYDDDFDYEVAPQSDRNAKTLRVDEAETAVGKPASSDSARRSKVDSQSDAQNPGEADAKESKSESPIVQKSDQVKSVPSAPHSGPQQPLDDHQAPAQRARGSRRDASEQSDTTKSNDDGFGQGIF